MNPAENPDLTEQWHFVVRLLKARAWTILTFLAVTLVVVVIGTLFQRPVYRASAAVLIDMETPNVLTVSTTRDDTQVGQSNYVTYADYYRTQVEIFQSRTIGQRVFNNLNLKGKPRYEKSKDPIGELLEQIAVEPVKQTRLTTLYASDPDPKQAARIANEFALVFAEENLAKTAANEAMTLMKNEYLKLQSKEAELSKRYKPKFPARARVRQQMEQLALAIEAEMERELHSDRREVYDASFVDDLASKSVLERLRENSMTGGLRPNNIRVQDLAEVPVKRYKPNLAFNLALGLIFGLLGGLGAGVVEELLDNSLKVPEDIERDPRLIYLGYVPSINGIHSASEAAADSWIKHRFQSIEVDASSQVAEAYRALRTNLLFAAPQGDAHTLVVTSPASEEGKTTTVTNLGIALSQIGLRVLCVDADLRKPRLHQIFGLNQSPGLSEYLTGQAPIDEIIQPAGIKGLWVIPSGAVPPNPAELLGSPKMKEFLKEVDARFDRILLDAPPVIPVTDAVVLAAITGSVLAVAQSGKTPKQALYRLAATINEVHAKVLGIVLNNVPPRNVPLYGYGYTTYHYGHPSGEEYEEHHKDGSRTGKAQHLSALIRRFKSNRDRTASGEKGEKVAAPPAH